MAIRKMTEKERDQLFGNEVVIATHNPKSPAKRKVANPDDSGVNFLRHSKRYGKGFSASLMDGPSVDLFKIAGLEWTSELNDAVWGQYNWKSLLEECKGIEIIETGSQNHAPGMSDVRFWVAVFDPKEFQRELRDTILAAAK
jgi:hypothetical protein